MVYEGRTKHSLLCSDPRRSSEQSEYALGRRSRSKWHTRGWVTLDVCSDNKERGSTAILRVLIDYGALPDLHGTHTPLSYLVAYHARPNLPKHHSNEINRIWEGIQYLLEKGACIDGMDSVPLCEAARKYNAPLVKKLLQHGAQVKLLENGHSARWHAKENLYRNFPTIYKEVDNLLKKKGGKLI